MALEIIEKEIATKEQIAKIDELFSQGYLWNRIRSACAAGVILEDPQSNDFWFFGMDGEIMHNPEEYSITI